MTLFLQNSSSRWDLKADKHNQQKVCPSIGKKKKKKNQLNKVRCGCKKRFSPHDVIVHSSKAVVGSRFSSTPPGELGFLSDFLQQFQIQSRETTQASNELSQN